MIQKPPTDRQDLLNDEPRALRSVLVLHDQCICACSQTIERDKCASLLELDLLDRYRTPGKIEGSDLNACTT